MPRIVLTEKIERYRRDLREGRQDDARIRQDALHPLGENPMKLSWFQANSVAPSLLRFLLARFFNRALDFVALLFHFKTAVGGSPRRRTPAS